MSAVEEKYFVLPPTLSRGIKREDLEWFDTKEQAELYAAMVGGHVRTCNHNKPIHVYSGGHIYVIST